MSGLSPKLPLIYYGPEGDYLLNKTYKEMIRQNLKNLLLTIPGERMMDMNFGVGLKKFLFENITGATKEEIATKINNQVKFYMPFVKVRKVDFFDSEDNFDINNNLLHCRVEYFISPLGTTDLLEV